MEEDLRAQLLGHAALAALVSDRISWGQREQGGALPAVVLQRISGAADYTTTGRTALAQALVQVDCWGSSYAEAKTLSRAVTAALDGLTGAFRGPGFIQAERDDSFRADAPGGDGSQNLYRTSLDVRVWSHAA